MSASNRVHDSERNIVVHVIKTGLRRCRCFGRRRCCCAWCAACAAVFTGRGAHAFAPAEQLQFGSDDVEPDASLFDLLYSLPDHAVVCSHGDVIPALVNALGASGMRVHGASEWGKGSVWVLERHEGRFVSAHAWAPPVIE